MRNLYLLFLVSTNVFGATYYIDYAGGSDSSSGTSQGAPWKRHPYMRGWAGGYTHTAGDRFYFKGGVTWPNNCFTMVIAAGGVVGNMDYYGTSAGWGTGKAIFNGEHIATSHGHIVSFSLKNGIIFDNIEIKGQLNGHPGTTGLLYGSIRGQDSSNIICSNLWVHDWRIVPNSPDDSSGGIIFMFGQANFGNTNTVVTHCELSNGENQNQDVARHQNGIALREVAIIKYNYIHHVQAAIIHGGQEVHHNHIHNINWPVPGFFAGGGMRVVGGVSYYLYHPNTMLLQGSASNGTRSPATAQLVHGNVIYDWGNGATPGVYTNPSGDSTIKIWNNALYGHNDGQGCIQVDPYNFGGQGLVGSVEIYNNTLGMYGNSSPIHVGNRSAANLKIRSLTVMNNHGITPLGNSAIHDGGATTVGTINSANNLMQSYATAAGHGYTLANRYRPTSASSPTVNVGVAFPSYLFSVDSLGKNRPIGGSWDIGAYEFGVIGPAPPQNLRIVASP